ncbi:MAG: hypothetical protein CMG74_10290 [Candidatus Marinimicrobia bacterium]|nr:hypothetical protein [Candidatus Neomarinimicrobiota bacterium]|tara:strand:+ start:3437 stop:4702 length:1266 start_codon:yes stop_codon:yes gene_type:complete
MIILPIILLIIISILTKFITKTWTSPGAFFCICWSFFSIVPILFASDYKIDHLAIWFIAIFSMSLASGSIVAYSNNPINQKYFFNTKIHFNYQFLIHAMLFFSSISLLGIFLLIKHATDIYSLGNYLSEWIIIPNMISVDRYSGLLNYPFIIKYSLYFIYPANLLGGIIFGYNDQSKRIKIISFLPLLLSILLGIIEGARTSMLLGLVLFFSSWLSTYMVNPKNKINRKKSYSRVIISSIASLTIFTLFFILIQWLRQGTDTIIFELLFDRIRAYFFGYLPAFSKWIISDMNYKLNNGLITFAGPFNLIGILDRPLGFYDSIYIAKDISTNIFTAFRGIIIDFSIPGAIFIAFPIGYIIQSIFQNNSAMSFVNTIPISMFYAFTIYSPLISIFHYNSILFAWFILLIILFIAKYAVVVNYR